MRTNLIRATANHAARTFTLRTEGKKYRTLKLNREEFQSCLHNTDNDWKQFLKSDEYYVVK